MLLTRHGEDDLHPFLDEFRDEVLSDVHAASPIALGTDGSRTSRPVAGGDGVHRPAATPGRTGPVAVRRTPVDPARRRVPHHGLPQFAGMDVIGTKGGDSSSGSAFQEDSSRRSGTQGGVR
ncbi:hypothetical protein [Micromonospora sp. RL09-050-HVF-A]|uniref:hypothetical protein n=1 Tax=Micromonospora sp. RL09-050-HVF-A TaxID=1703433 RepID=UPI001C5DA1EF|nr:hypothetical protein [Micromonospora sp. RL09-050-HVF-A]MBW4702632.1 hypothetical protein [Micromonospora sp. RL09-050-HVF-A]